jgi:hypothetical protein
VSDRTGAAAVVHEVLAARWPGRFRAEALDGQASLGEGGLELDSIEIAELLVECLDRLRLPSTRADELLEAGPVSVGGLIDHLARA